MLKSREKLEVHVKLFYWKKYVIENHFKKKKNKLPRMCTKQELGEILCTQDVIVHFLVPSH